MRDALSSIVVRLIRRDGQSGAADAAADDSGSFAGSLLDASVNYSHGQSDRQASSEMAELQEEANRLAEQDQHRK
ncbi:MULTISPECIES: hypothetical protein [Haloarcula]|uniref:Uncharacterized protein n=1 Tax=Haloarcula hispanica TaxID=51589 RepID=A0A5J5LGN3_HALHI|nr:MULTISPECIES: hypothetical protein [Haloarcula]AJF26185.1 hypothetical protein SG26_10830 [Haloarcula sp. CBA1115]KAA9408003.1 hypothetical protein Har1131_14695 [Haloarcula sp. CBA1131]KAA9408949.1 hypothetical protein EGO51_03815 [Haloarcula hispanica]KZX48959.1 hypothetical protein AV929_18700 [Haloarcula sp. K1]MUV51064.1 hypothetical protein [Haloarcula sp. CBA1122]